ncbi:PilC/PilY family type IV pilus protein [uncultured Pseudomonas sp.]|uniref:PilC/PilY family type IV pilus protein n=1 Tax=uncultured Pseudomonas sp. TaxID=114707 RepID=UPI0025F3196E|nr:PilC/PilY family type IV pilus protein [uncultured Pseudomonas sp.]
MRTHSFLQATLLTMTIAFPAKQVLAAGGENNPAQSPLFVSRSTTPLNMLVMGRDHKLYYEAYNDASDLNGDGVIDVGYKGHLAANQGGIDYFGYFNSNVCYTYTSGTFVPTAVASNKRCSGQWSGDYLNYLTTSRMDALRKVLYGGYRVTDTEGSTLLQGAYIPRDAHAWGKEYNTRDGYNITDYTPLAQPSSGYHHMFAVVSKTQDTGIPQLRVLTNTSFRVWNWVSKERPVAMDNCIGSSGSEVSCTSGGPADSNWSLVPNTAFSNKEIKIWKNSSSLATPSNTTQMNNLFSSTSYSLCGTQNNIGYIQSPSTSNNNIFNPTGNGSAAVACRNNRHDYYHTQITGTFTPNATASYQFSVDGDDAVDFSVLDGTLVLATASRYGDNGRANQGGQGTTATLTLTAGKTYNIRLRHRENAGDDNWYVYWRNAGNAPSTMTDYNVRVEVCSTSNASLREDNCKVYGSGAVKPTGILHDFGETNKMHFGLLTGSYGKHMSGGTLRANMGSFTREVDPYTGQFCSSDNSYCSNQINNPSPQRNGIVATINKLRIYDFNYSNNQYGCGWITTSAMSQNNNCYMWGNPVSEMMYETLRYFAGAGSPTSLYDYSGGADETLGLAKPSWVSPYARSGSNYPACSIPAMTVISDINPSYDYKLPGGTTSWQTDNTAFSNQNDPASIQNLDVSTETNAIGVSEGLVGKNVFIGESNGVSDNAPTAKVIADLATVRGLAPEEPSKQGTYYSAGVARFAANNAIGGSRMLQTYAVALASPLPQIDFPVGNNRITLVPFAKSVGGSGISNTGSFQPTNQIVDFYVQKIANTDPDGSDRDTSVNGGRPYAEFRINYEDVEQGADHDMDAIALYTLSVNASNELKIDLFSEYAAGGIQQHMGYVISGTGAATDGIYLEICDLRTGGTNGGDRASCEAQTRYRLNTPPDRPAGWCVANLNNAECAGLPPTATRTFTASPNSSNAELLRSPLWYAAKYGMPDRDPRTVQGDPDNYFLVTNALTLKEQLTKAFNNLEQSNNSVTSPAISVAGNEASDDLYIYRTDYKINTWSGDLIKEQLDRTTGTRTQLWSASSKLTSAGRTIRMANTAGNGLQDLTWSNLANRQAYNNAGTLVNLQAAMATDLATGTPAPLGQTGLSNANTTLGQNRLNFVKGTANANFRRRDSLLGDIINSNPTVVGGAQYLAYLADSIEPSGSYSSFAQSQSSRSKRIYVGANDGMLHAFDDNGNEQFAFVPTAVIPELYRLADPDFNEEGGVHKFYVDGTPVVRDVFINNQWRTVLIGTLRAGGRAIFALDITEPSNISLLWEFNVGQDIPDDAPANTPSDLGYSFPTPTVAKLHSGQWAVVTGNGYDSDSGRAVLMLIDIETGNLIKKIPTAAADTNNGLSTVRVADNNSDGFADYVYAGDLKGNLWRFDLIDSGSNNPLTRSSDINPDNFKVSFGGNPLYTARNASGEAQPITAPPSLVRHPSMNGYIVMFGTGRYFREADKSNEENAIVQSLYGVWDRKTAGETTNSSDAPTLTRSDLQAQEFTNATATFQNGATTISRTVRTLSEQSVAWRNGDQGKYGWYLDLRVGNTIDGERIVNEMAARGQVLFVSSLTPSSDPCSAGLEGWTYGINPFTGGRANFAIFDFNNDGVVNANDNYEGQSISGFKTPAGGFTLSGGTLFSTDGTSIDVNYGPSVSGRQSWQILPEND